MGPCQGDIAVLRQFSAHVINNNIWCLYPRLIQSYEEENKKIKKEALIIINF